jgi:FkbM family methyltransferase
MSFRAALSTKIPWLATRLRQVTRGLSARAERRHQVRAAKQIKVRPGTVVVQIGTNDGNDVFNWICRRVRPSKVVLVEPFVECTPSIVENYKRVKNVSIENVAITVAEKKTETLVMPRARGGITSQYSILPMDDWGDDLLERQVPAMTFSQLCEKHGIGHIHFLQIDTEGFDAEIIKSIDFERIRIDILKYEKWNFPVDAFQRHGDKGKTYGVAGMTQVSTLLKKLGYILRDEGSDIVATRSAR